MDFALTINGATADMSWNKAETILNNIWLSLMVPKGYFFAAPDFGSRLHLLLREKITARTLALAEQYALEATQWIIDAGRATLIDVSAQADRTTGAGRINMLIRAKQADGRLVTFDYFVEVV